MHGYRHRRGPWAQYAQQVDVLGQVTRLSKAQYLAKAEAADQISKHDKYVEQAELAQDPAEAVDPAEQIRGRRFVRRDAQARLSAGRRTEPSISISTRGQALLSAGRRTEDPEPSIRAQAIAGALARQGIPAEVEMRLGRREGLWQAEESTDPGQGSEAGWVPGYAEGGQMVQPTLSIPGSPGRVIQQRSYAETGRPAFYPPSYDVMRPPIEEYHYGDSGSRITGGVRSTVDSLTASYPDPSGTAFPGLTPSDPSPPVSLGPGVVPVPGYDLPGPAAPFRPPGLVTPLPPEILPGDPDDVRTPNAGYRPRVRGWRVAAPQYVPPPPSYGTPGPGPGPGAWAEHARGPQPGPGAGSGGGGAPNGVDLEPVPAVPEAKAKAQSKWWLWMVLAGAGGYWLWRRQK